MWKKWFGRIFKFVIFFKVRTSKQSEQQRRRSRAANQGSIGGPQFGKLQKVRLEAVVGQIVDVFFVGLPFVHADDDRVALQNVGVLHHQSFSGRKWTRNWR
jgi:hypothetical protein